MISEQELVFGTRITTGPAPWQVLQRAADGKALVTLEGIWAADTPCVVEVRVAHERDNAPAPGCDWRAAEMVGEHDWRCTLHVPTGGLYRIETRLYRAQDNWRGAGAKIWHVAVGDVWVIAGQSNSSGCGGHGTVVDPPALGVSVYALNDEWRLATHPIFDPTDTHYQVSTDTIWVDVSPWLAFGKEILAQAHVPVGLIPAGLGGSPLRRWDPGDPCGADLWHNMLRMIENAGGKVAGLVWYQGCSDCDADCSVTYLSRFARFVDAMRQRYGENLPVITAQLNRVNNVETRIDPYWAVLREQQRQAARTIPQVAVVPTQDLTMSDAIHTSAVGNVTLGERFARAALGMVYGQDIPWKPVDVRAAEFTDETRTGIRLRFDNVVDHLYFSAQGCMVKDFTVQDEDGDVPVKDGRIEDRVCVLVDLARPATGNTIIHNLYGRSPISTVHDHLGRPLLAFTGLEVNETE